MDAYCADCWGRYKEKNFRVFAVEKMKLNTKSGKLEESKDVPDRYLCVKCFAKQMIETLELKGKVATQTDVKVSSGYVQDKRLFKRFKEKKKS